MVFKDMYEKIHTLNQETETMMCTGERKLKSDQGRRRKVGHKSVVDQEVMNLKKRLTHVEEETNMMKQEMLQNKAERKTLMTDVYHQLKFIHFSLHHQNNQTFGYKFSKEGRMVDGLCQVLYEDWKPLVFIRGGLGANSVRDNGSSDSKLPNILCLEYK